MNREATATALVLIAVISGEHPGVAIARAAEAFGGSSTAEVERAVSQSRWASGSRTSKLRIALLRQRSAGCAGRVVVRRATAAAVGLTLMVLACVVPGSSEVGLAGW